MRPFLRLLPHTAIVAGAIAVGACGPPGEGHMEREEKHFFVTGKPELVLSTFDGSIEVRTWDRPEVLVTVEKTALSTEAAAAVEVHTAQNGNRITVDLREGRPTVFWFLGIHWGGWTSARLVASIPAASDLRARSGDGSITVEGIIGKVELRSGDGGIRGRGLSGDVSAHTGDGSISLEGVNGRLEAESGDGSVTVAGLLTGLHVRAGDGSVAIRLEQDSAAGEDWDIRTGDGSITMEVPDGLNADLDAHTGDGRISLHDVGLADVTGQGRGGNVRGRLGLGGRAIRLRTGDGSITLRRS